MTQTAIKFYDIQNKREMQKEQLEHEARENKKDRTLRYITAATDLLSGMSGNVGKWVTAARDVADMVARKQDSKRITRPKDYKYRGTGTYGYD